MWLASVALLSFAQVELDPHTRSGDCVGVVELIGCYGKGDLSDAGRCGREHGAGTTVGHNDLGSRGYERLRHVLLDPDSASGIVRELR